MLLLILHQGKLKFKFHALESNKIYHLEIQRHGQQIVIQSRCVSLRNVAEVTHWFSKGAWGSQQSSHFLQRPGCRVLAQCITGIYCLEEKNSSVTPGMWDTWVKATGSKYCSQIKAEDNRLHIFMSSNTRGHFYKSFLFLILFSSWPRSGSWKEMLYTASKNICRAPSPTLVNLSGADATGIISGFKIINIFQPLVIFWAKTHRIWW